MTSGTTKAGHFRRQNGSTEGKQSPIDKVNNPSTYHQPTINREGFHRQANPTHCPKSKGAQRDKNCPHSQDVQDDHTNSKGVEEIKTDTTGDCTKQDT